MILDTLKNAPLYYCLGRRFETGLRFLQEHWEQLEQLENGIHEIDGRDVYLLLRRYDTVKRADAKLEAHQRYADIQILKQGRERFGYQPLSTVGRLLEDFPERDVAYFEGDPEFFTLGEDLFVIVLPQDAHCPDCALDDTPGPVLKAVLKIRVSDD